MKTLLLLTISLTSILTAHSQSIQSVPPDKSNLPEGKGLAANFAADVSIETHPAVRFADQFEGPSIESIGSKWGEVRNRQKKVLSLAETFGAEELLGTQSLQVTSLLDENTGGGMTQWFEPASTLYFRFYTRFDENCDYIHHFCTLRANKNWKGGDKWTGFGGAGKKPDGVSRFSTALEPWGNWGNNPAPGRWNFYSYWPDMKPSPDGNYWGNSFRPDDSLNPVIPKGEWICAEFMIRHNTPGEADGEQAFWINGELVGHWKGFAWRESPDLFANAFTLESYVTDRWTKNRKNIVWFDNVVIATEYIGPTSAAEK